MSGRLIHAFRGRQAALWFNVTPAPAKGERRGEEWWRQRGGLGKSKRPRRARRK